MAYNEDAIATHPASRRWRSIRTPQRTAVVIIIAATLRPEVLALLDDLAALDLLVGLISVRGEVLIKTCVEIKILRCVRLNHRVVTA